MVKAFFRVEMLPALDGDALFVEYGSTRTRRLLIDGGPLGAFPALERRLEQLPAGNQSVDLLVVTHVDTDHIEGIIRLMALPEPRWPVQLGQIWFNGWRHLERRDTLGGREGEFMSALISRRANDRWNTAFGGDAVRCGVLPGDKATLADGMTLTVLSPTTDGLAALRKKWEKTLQSDKWDIAPGDLEAAWANLVEESRFHPDAELTLGPEDLTQELRRLLKGVDGSETNGSSIAFLAEFAGRSCLFLGDAHMKVICASLKGLGYTRARPLKVDAVKVAHHGSKNNVTQEFLGLVDAKHWLFSTNGAVHKHPDPEGVEAVIRGTISSPTLWFNYRTPQTERWEAGAAAAGARYRAKYPARGKEGIVVRL
jgi:hypothetical protein